MPSATSKEFSIEQKTQILNYIKWIRSLLDTVAEHPERYWEVQAKFLENPDSMTDVALSIADEQFAKEVGHLMVSWGKMMGAVVKSFKK